MNSTGVLKSTIVGLFIGILYILKKLFIYPEEYVSLERYQADNQRTCFISIPHTIPIPQAKAQLETV